MKRRYAISIIYTLLFLVDVVTGALANGNSDTWENAYLFALDFQKWRETFILLLIATSPIVAITFTKLKLHFDMWDWCVFSVWLLSQAITVFDYHHNANQREVEVDYLAFGFVLFAIWILKFVDLEWKRLQNLLKTRR